MWGKTVTNGTLFTEDIIRSLIEIKWDIMTFSIDSVEENLHDELRGTKGAFGKILKAVDRINALKARAKTAAPLIDINFVLCNLNYKQCSRMIEFAKNTGFAYVTFIPLSITRPDAKILGLDLIEKKELLDKLNAARQKSRDLNMFTNLDHVINIFS